MKIMILCVTNVISVLLHAQSYDDEVTYIQTIWEAEKRQLVKDYMKLRDYEAEAFWEVYNEYERSRKALMHKNILLVKDYTDNFESLTEGKANNIAKKLMTNNLNYEKLNKEYYGKFKRATSAIKAIQFFQLESYIASSLYVYLLDNGKMTGELIRVKK